MSNNIFYNQCVEIHDVLRLNVHDVRKVCLEMILCVYGCFVEFYVFVLNETHVVGSKLV